jgi:hypothetical protein
MSIMDLHQISIPGQRTIPVISLWLPWALWVLWGWKPLETRTHDRFKSLEGKTIGIHAANTWDIAAIAAARPYLTAERIQRTMAEVKKPCGGRLLCTGRVDRTFVTKPSDASLALIECDTVRFGLLLSNIVPLDPPILMKGRQGIWRATIPC